MARKVSFKSFLNILKRRKGFGEQWSFDGKYIRTKGYRCPLQAWTGVNIAYEEEAKKRGMSDRTVRVVINAADTPLATRSKMALLRALNLV